MIDGEVTDQSKFLTADTKMIQLFSVGSMVFKDADPTSGSSQVKIGVKIQCYELMLERLLNADTHAFSATLHSL